LKFPAFLGNGFIINVILFDNSNLVCRINKAIQGLKQAPRSWFLKLSATLFSLGFHFAKSDSSLFIRFQKDITLLVLIYFNDIIITGNNFHVFNTLFTFFTLTKRLKT